MAKMRKIDGVWRTVADRYRKVDGVWRKVKESYRKIDGVWIKTFGEGYLQPYVIDPDLSDAGVYFDSATGSYRAYIYGRPNHSSTVEVGIRIGNIPAKSTVMVELSTYDGITNNVAVSMYSNGEYLGHRVATKTVTHTTYQEVSGEFIMKIQFAGTNTDVTKMNFALSDVQINGESIPMP